MAFRLTQVPFPNLIRVLILIYLWIVVAITSSAQEPTPVLDSTVAPATRLVFAGKYPQSGLRNFFLGKHYRNEWHTPVTVHDLLLDTAFGGLTPYEATGGSQGKSLHLRGRDGREYFLRSLDMSFGRVLPSHFRGTVVENLVEDQVTVSHPYSAVTIPQLAKAAKILHTEPIIRYVPAQPALGQFNDSFGNYLYLLERRPHKNWETEPDFAKSSNIINTEDLLQNLLESKDHTVDQLLYIRSRLFDMFIGDWSRHEDQWAWAAIKANGSVTYKPIPHDRDQAYSRFDGLLPKLVLRAANLDYLQSFTYRVEEVEPYGYPARHLDRRCTNEVTLDQWTSIARDLQQSLTDEVIESAVRQMPPEVFPLSGPWIMEQLKSRRERLVEIASTYYKFLARHVDIPGTIEDEFFEVKRIDEHNTKVKVYTLVKGTPVAEPHYSRTFSTEETKEIRLFGIGGNDVFHADGNVGKGIQVRFIGGPQRDSFADHSNVRDLQKKTHIYDDKNNQFTTSGETRLHLSSDAAVHEYDYTEFEYHKKGIKLEAFYDNPDRFYVGVGYSFKRHMWRKVPYGFEQSIFGRYSLSQNAFSITYEGIFHQVFGKWDGTIFANYDAVRWTNFSGLGNETTQPVDNRDYYRLRTNEFVGSLGLNRTFRSFHNVDITASFNAVEIIEDPGRFVTDFYTPNELYYSDHHQFASVRVGYTFQRVNDNIVPTKGAMVYAGAAYTQNVEEHDRAFATYNGIAHLFIPLFGKFSISSRTGIATVSGNPEFYQYVAVGGSQTLRGFRRDRFWGKTAFYNSNELRWITDFRSYLMTGKFGLLGFVDNGRVWMPDEDSDKWHVGYGGGFMLAPFNKISASVTYGISPDGKVFHLRLNKLLF